MSSNIKCPKCHSDAFYRYGKAHTGKDRFLCLMCGRQFTLGSNRHKPQSRPSCPVCGKPMLVYMRQDSNTRFRCSCYPECMTYLKVANQPGLGRGAVKFKTGKTMISTACSIKEFIETVRKKDALDIIHLADKEALEAWRYSIHSQTGEELNQKKCADYELRLKKFVSLLRSSIIPVKERDLHH